MKNFPYKLFLILAFLTTVVMVKCQKISELPNVNDTLHATDKLPIVHTGTTDAVTVQQLRTDVYNNVIPYTGADNGLNIASTKKVELGGLINKNTLIELRDYGETAAITLGDSAFIFGKVSMIDSNGRGFSFVAVGSFLGVSNCTFLMSFDTSGASVLIILEPDTLGNRRIIMTGANASGANASINLQSDGMGNMEIGMTTNNAAGNYNTTVIMDTNYILCKAFNSDSNTFSIMNVTGSEAAYEHTNSNHIVNGIPAFNGGREVGNGWDIVIDGYYFHWDTSDHTAPLGSVLQSNGEGDIYFDAVPPDSNNWSLHGNSGLKNSSPSKFLGTKDSAYFLIATNGFISGLIDPDKQNTSLGWASYPTISTAAPGYYSVAGLYNSSFGAKSLYGAWGCSKNTAIGSFALTTDSSGNLNTASGFGALGMVKTGSNNVAIGDSAGFWGNNNLKFFLSGIGFPDSVSQLTHSLLTGTFNANPLNQILNINGTVGIIDGTQSNNYVFTCNSNGIGSWQAPKIAYKDTEVTPVNGGKFVCASNQSGIIFIGSITVASDTVVFPAFPSNDLHFTISSNGTGIITNLIFQTSDGYGVCTKFANGISLSGASERLAIFHVNGWD